VTDLGTDSYASDINAAGQVVGHCETADKSRKHAFLYCPGAGMKDLGTLGGSVSAALRINDLGQVVGCSYAATDAGNGGPRAFLYADGSGMKDLGLLAGGSGGCAFGINRTGQVVGDVLDSHGGAILAFLHQPDGTMIDLNAAVDPALGWTLTSAKAVNDSGQIAGYGTAPDGNTRAFVLTPLAKARDAGAAGATTATGIGATADVGATVKLSPQPQTDKPSRQPQTDKPSRQPPAEPTTTRGERRALPMNH
jgi:probable HAF family extracellular repeat protein